MKLTTILRDNSESPAALLHNGSVLDLACAARAGILEGPPLVDIGQLLQLDSELFSAARNMVGCLEAGASLLEERLAEAGAFLEEESVVYSALLKPRLILASGMGYREHMKEMGVASPSAPTAFLKSPGALNAHRQPLRLPPQDADMVDFECEFACVIGRPFHNVSPEEALKHVAGYTMVNDVSSRRHTQAWLASMGGTDPMECMRLQALSVFDKQLPGFCPIGPVIVTADEFGDPNEVTVETRLNGELMQRGHASDLYFPLAYSLSFFSRWFRFQPGDVVTTGSPSGVGFARNPQRFLKNGDVIEVAARNIGTLRNPVVASEA